MIINLEKNKNGPYKFLSLDFQVGKFDVETSLDCSILL